MRTFFEFRKDMRIAAVVELYKTEEMSISKAAELAGVSTREMKDFLAKAGVRIRRGLPETGGEGLAINKHNILESLEGSWVVQPAASSEWLSLS